MSPISAKLSTATTMARPGNKATHHTPRIICCAPVETISPHSGVGMRTPAPTKDRPAVSNMARPTLIEICTMAGVSALGRMWRNMMEKSVAPLHRAAPTKGRSRSESTSARMTRANIGMNSTASTMATFQISWPMTDTSAMPSTNTGKDWMKSNSRITSEDSQPR